MTIENVIRASAGFGVVASVALTHFISPAFIYLTLFIGLNLFQSAFTGFCPLAIVLKKAGMK